MSDYASNTEANQRPAKGNQMTIMIREEPADLTVRPVRPSTVPPRRPTPVRGSRSQRPTGTPFRHRGTGVLTSRASHRRAPVSPFATVVLALVAAAITVWLGVVAQLGAADGPTSPAPARLAVIQVQAGESLEQVARRVAPDSAVEPVVEQIRDLNKLDSAAVGPGQTLIAPVG